MVWLSITIVVALAVLVALVMLVAGVRARGEEPTGRQGRQDVDPLFSTGIAIAGAGVALAVSIGPVMYAMTGIGMIVMMIGIRRTRTGNDHVEAEEDL